MRGLGLLGPVFRRDPVHDILAIGVWPRPSSHSATVVEFVAIACAWAATSGEQAVVGCPALICDAHSFMSCVYCSIVGADT